MSLFHLSFVEIGPNKSKPTKSAVFRTWNSSDSNLQSVWFWNQMNPDPTDLKESSSRAEEFQHTCYDTTSAIVPA